MNTRLRQASPRRADGHGWENRTRCESRQLALWERWRLAGEFRFLAPDQPAGRQRSQEVHGESEPAAKRRAGDCAPYPGSANRLDVSFGNHARPVPLTFHRAGARPRCFQRFHRGTIA